MEYFKGKKLIVTSLLICIVFILLGIFMPKDILATPIITPSAYLLSKPYIEIFGKIIIVPSSTVIVYLLGCQITFLGFLFYRKELPLWGLSLFFWGLGTILAGTSYQGLGYELKCSGNQFCQFTSWFELAYLFVTALSVSLMGLAFSKLFISSNKKRILEGYSITAIVVYTLILVIGSILQNATMISYEVFTVFFMPLFLVFFIINIHRFIDKRDELNKSFIILWILFLIVNLSYYVYYIPGFTSLLYDNTGIWFSANDVLHVGLIGWFLFFQSHTLKRMVIDNK